MIEINGELPESRLVFVNKKEAEFLDQCSREMDISESAVFKQSLRFYQLCKVRGYIDEIMAKERTL